MKPRSRSRHWAMRLAVNAWFVACFWWFLIDSERFGLPPWLWYLLAAVLVLPWPPFPVEGLTVTREELRLVRWPWVRQRFAWEEIREVAAEGKQWRIKTPDGTCWLRRGTARSTRAGAKAADFWRASHGLVEPAQPGTATPEEMRHLLGLQPGEVLSGWHTRGWRLVVRWYVIVSWVGWVVLGMIDGVTLGDVMQWLALAGMFAMSFFSLGPPGFAADEHGLTVRGTHQYGPATRLGWRDVHGLRRTAAGLELLTPNGPIALSSRLPNLDRLASAIETIVAAREAGVILPRLVGGVPQAALSRASMTTGEERGLSRGE